MITGLVDEARRAETRLRATHQWLQTQDDQLPLAPSDRAGNGNTLRDIDTFWDTPVASSQGGTPIKRRQAFARQLEFVATDDATWRLADGTLPAEAGFLLRSLPTDTDTRLPPHMHAEELVIDNVSYAGMLLLRSDLYPDTVLFFSCHQGWKAFASRKDALAHVERHIRQTLASQAELPGMARTTIEPPLGNVVVRGRSMVDPLYTVLAERMIQRHRQKVEASLALDDPDAFYDASTLHTLIDLWAMDMDRSAIRHALARKPHPTGQPLAAYPPTLRDAALKASGEYDVATLRMVDAMMAGAIIHPRSMSTFLREELASHLHGMGINDDPESIWIKRRTFPLGIIKAASALMYGGDESMINLLDFARWNVGSSELDLLTVVDAHGRPHTRLNVRSVVEMVRSIDAGRRYIEHVDNHMDNSDMGLRYRKMARTRWMARIQLDAVNARLAHHDGTHHPGLLPDARERAYHWIEATLAHPEPSSRQSVDGDDLVVQQLTYLDATVSGVFLIAARHGDASSHVVVYTPDAPDRVAFREFRTRDDMVRHFLLDRSFEAYLLAHLPLEFTTTDANGRPHFDVSESTKRLRWVLSNDGCGFCTTLVEPFAYQDVITDIADVAYDTEREQERRTFRHVSRSTEQADDDAANQRYRIPHALAGMPGEASGFLATMAAQSLTTATNSAWRLYDDLKKGDYAGAFVDAVSVYVNGLDVVTLGPTPGAWSHGALRRLTKVSTARRAGLSIPVAQVDDLAATSPLVALAETQWPSHAYYHASPTELKRLERVGMLVLLQSRLGKGDLRGVPLVVLPPGQHPPSSRYPAGWMPASAEGAPSSPGTWVRIDLQGALRGTNLSANSFNVYRPIDGDGNLLILRPGEPLPIMGGAAPLILFDHYTMESAPAA